MAIAAAAHPSIPTKRSINLDEIVPFGITPGQNQVSGTCEGYKGARISCTCPPRFTDFVENLNKNVIPTGPDPQLGWSTEPGHRGAALRLQEQIDTLIYMTNSFGERCTVDSTNWADLLQAHKEGCKQEGTSC